MKIKYYYKDYYSEDYFKYKFRYYVIIKSLWEYLKK